MSFRGSGLTFYLVDAGIPLLHFGGRLALPNFPCDGDLISIQHPMLNGSFLELKQAFPLGPLMGSHADLLSSTCVEKPCQRAGDTNSPSSPDFCLDRT